MATPPALIAYDDLRKRNADYVAELTSTYGSASASGYSIQCSQAFPTGSAGFYLTQSVADGYSSPTNAVAGETTPASEGISSSVNVTIPATTSTTVPHASSPQGLGGSATTSSQLVYTSVAFTRVLL
jgi:hypothetical protein